MLRQFVRPSIHKDGQEIGWPYEDRTATLPRPPRVLKAKHKPRGYEPRRPSGLSPLDLKTLRSNHPVVAHQIEKPAYAFERDFALEAWTTTWMIVGLSDTWPVTRFVMVPKSDGEPTRLLD